MVNHFVKKNRDTSLIQEIYSHYTLPDDTGINKEINKVFEEKTGKRYKKQNSKLQEKNNGTYFLEKKTVE